MNAHVDAFLRSAWQLETDSHRCARAWYDLCDSGHALTRKDLDQVRSARAALRVAHVSLNICAQDIDDLLALAIEHGVHQ